MNTGKLNKLYFSQYALSTYRTCPLKFRHRYVDGLYWPRSWSTPEEKQRVEKGRQFHLLAQRYFDRIAINIPQGTEHAKTLQTWLDELQKFVPLNEKKSYYPEYVLRLNRNGIKLQAKYDLIITTSDNRVIIYDWKTDAKPVQERLLKSLQTICYLYLLPEAGPGVIAKQPLKPEQVTMIYWNPLFPAKSLKIEYSFSKHAYFEKQLHELINNILGSSYEQFKPCLEKEYCQKCEYSPICHGVGVEIPEAPEEDETLESQIFNTEDPF